MSFLEVIRTACGRIPDDALIFGVTLVGAIPLGLLIMFGSMSKFQPVKWLFKIFVWIIRGTPLHATDNPGILRSWSDGTGREV